MNEVQTLMHTYNHSCWQHDRHIAWRRLKRRGIHLPDPSRNPTVMARQFNSLALAAKAAARAVARAVSRAVARISSA